jgi:hypothetical protein
MYPMTAVYHDTPSEPRGPWVHPGQYVVRLTANGSSYDQPLTVKMDPRVKTPAAGLQQQFDLSMQCYDGTRQARETSAQVRSLRSQIKELQGKDVDKEIAAALADLDKKLTALEGTPPRGRGGRGAEGPREVSLAGLAQEMQQLLRILQGADATPTTTAATACEQTGKALREIMTRWGELKDKDVKALNERLTKAGLTPLTAKAEAGKGDYE